jgi:hypothetical protein
MSIVFHIHALLPQTSPSSCTSMYTPAAQFSTPRLNAKYLLLGSLLNESLAC